MSMKQNIELTEFVCGEMELTIEFIQEYHLRIKGESKRLDYFPKSGRATWVGSGKWFEIEHIDTFLEKHFKQ